MLGPYFSQGQVVLLLFFFPVGEDAVLDSNVKIFLSFLRRRAELSAAEASGSLGDHWFLDFPGIREDLPRERRGGMPWCGKWAARGEGVLFCLDRESDMWALYWAPHLLYLTDSANDLGAASSLSMNLLTAVLTLSTRSCFHLWALVLWFLAEISHSGLVLFLMWYIWKRAPLLYRLGAGVFCG